MRAIRLSELVQQGRLVMLAAVADEHSAAASQPAAGAASTAAPSAERTGQRPRVSADVVDKIELLAIELLSISRSSKADPEALMRSALISIDQCIVSISTRH